MKKHLFTLLLVASAFISLPATSQTNEKPFVIPELREWTGAEGTFTQLGGTVE